jgi:hypothetical protein
VLRNSRRALSMAAILAVGVAGLAGAEDGGVAASAGFDVNSAYIWRGITSSDAAVVQPWLDVSGIPLGKSASLGLNVWGNFALADWKPADTLIVEAGQYSEIDLTLTLSLPQGFSVGYIDYTFPATNGAFILPTREVFGAWSGSYVVDPSVSVYYDVGSVDSYYASLGLGKSFALNEKTQLGLNALAGLAGKKFAEAYGGTDGGLYNYNLSGKLSYQATEKASIGVTAGYAGNFDEKVLPDQDATFYGGASASFSF